jgi:hypothetical protein
LLRACSLAKNLQVRQKAEAEKEATNCVASDEESCRHVYKALAHGYLCGSIAGCFLIIIHQRPYIHLLWATISIFTLVRAIRRLDFMISHRLTTKNLDALKSNSI